MAETAGPVTRPLLRYHGGKWKLAEWIISQMPQHRIYVEPFGGAASVLLLKPRVQAEIYNDLENSVVNVFRVLQDPIATAQLRRRLYYTTFSRAEFDRSYEEPTDAIDYACKVLVRSFFGFGSDSVTRTCRTGFRARPSDDRALPAASWRTWFEEIPRFVDRLRGIVIENCDAIQLIGRYDAPDTLIYVDPPYVHSTRTSLKGKRPTGTTGYRFEMNDDEHRALALALHGAKGMVMLSGYESPLYEELYGDWLKTTHEAHSHAASRRTEYLWFNPAAARRRPQPYLAYAKEGAAA